jgi:transmembrane sensor
MTSDPNQDAQRALSEAATHWLVLMQTGELTNEQRVEFVDWLRASPLHISELLRVGELDGQLARLPIWPTLPAGMHLTSAVVGFRSRSPVARDRRARPDRRSRWAAAIALISAIGVGYMLLAPQGAIHLQTMAGEHRELALEDGSVVDLAPDTDLVVRYEAHRRGIVLAHGQAMFRVAKDSTRPFIVRAAQTQVRAVGTVFNVERDSKGILVSVVEGHVAVTQQSRLPDTLTGLSSTTAVSLNPNEELSIDYAGKPSAVRQVPHSVSSVRAGETLSFVNETVGELAQKFNARNRLHMDVLSPDVAARRISGVFFADDPESFVAFVEAVTGAQVRRQSPDLVTIENN